MDEAIVLYIDDTFSNELKEDIYKSFNLLNSYNYADPYSSFIDILLTSNYRTTDDMQDSFIAVLHNKLDFIINAHDITLVSDVTLEQKNELLAALLLIQDLEDYQPVIRMLETFESDHEILTNILADLCNLDQIQLLSIIDEIKPGLLNKLKLFIYQKEKNDMARIVTKDDKDLVVNLKHFHNFFTIPNVGKAMIDSNVIIGVSFNIYLPYVLEDLIAENNEQTALNIYSVLMMSEDGAKDPIGVYKEYSMQIFTDLNVISKIETSILNMIGKFTEYRKAIDEKARLS